jgi:putative heme-binding domain-containing protein
MPKAGNPAWKSVPFSPATVSPWGLESRTVEGGGPLKVLSSLASGKPEAEQATGLLLSRAFPAPAKLSFLICGHDGPPDAPAGGRNFVRLVDAVTGAELQKVAPPRQDMARRATWDLTSWAGREVRLEVVDQDTGSAYAWLAVGGFDPTVAAVESWEVEAQGSVRLAGLASLLKYAAPPVLRDRLAAFLPPPPPAPPSAVTPEQKEAADRLIAERTAAHALVHPDKTKGEAVFLANCAVCHAMEGKGALVGPQLDGIGNRGTARLMEDILDPGRNVDSHFRLHVITLQDGSVLAGLERGEIGEVLIVVDAAGQEHRLPKSGIKTNEETALSLMPAAFGQSIPEADFHHLIAWLASHRTG